MNSGEVKCISYKEVKFSMCHGQFHFHMSHTQHEQLEYYDQFILTLPLNILMALPRKVFAVIGIEIYPKLGVSCFVLSRVLSRGCDVITLFHLRNNSH